jgi:hypothetical protein
MALPLRLLQGVGEKEASLDDAEVLEPRLAAVACLKPAGELTERLLTVLDRLRALALGPQLGLVEAVEAGERQAGVLVCAGAAAVSMARG